MTGTTGEPFADPLPATVQSRPIETLFTDDPFEATFEAAGVGLAIVDLAGHYVRVNESYARMHDILPEDFVGEPLHYHAAVLPRLLAGADDDDLYARDEREVRPDVWVSLSVRLRHDGEGRPAWFVVDAEDITRRHRAERELEHRALHDDLTGLPNRVLVLDRLRQALARSMRGVGDVGVVFCDLDGFKAVNDRHGHLLGDIVLRVVATRLSAAVRPSDTVGRLGGDEFVIVVEPPVTEDDLAALARRVTESVSAPLRERGTDTRVGISVGIAHSDGDSTTAERLLDRADAAMYRAKRASHALPSTIP